MEAHDIKLKKNPEKNANPISKLFFCKSDTNAIITQYFGMKCSNDDMRPSFYVNPMLWFGFQNDINENDLHEVLPEDRVEELTEKLEGLWFAELRSSKMEGKSPSLMRAVLKCFGWKYMGYGLMLALREAVMIIQPLFMGFLIRYFNSNTIVTQNEAFLYAGAIASCSALYAMIHHPYYYGIQKIGMRIRVATSGLVFKKSLRLSSSALHKTGVGQIVNILSNDVARFDFAVVFMHYIWVVPLCTVAFVALIWYEIGVSCLAGFAAFLIIVPIQAYCGKKIGAYRHAMAEKADTRIGIMNELLNGIRVIKMYAWEKPFSQLIQDARKSEIRELRFRALFQAILIGIFYATGKIVLLVAITAYVMLGNDMNAEKIFTAAAWFNFARLSITLFLPFAFQFLFESKVTFERIEKFLLLEDFGDYGQSALEFGENAKMNGVHVENHGVQVKKLSAKWDADSDSSILHKISLNVKKGELLAIIGPVGAGKSSILSSILGEMRRTEGEVKVEGKIAYVPQEAWVFSSTLRQNITFGAEFMEEKYKKAIMASALKKDIEILLNGDSTLVGDRGVALSGGQRARVNLARALYRDADIYLFDDPLSAVDAQVGRVLFERCIMEYLSNKVRILVTHQLQYLAKADHIIMLRDGKIIAEGTLAELQKKGDEFTNILHETEKSYRQRLVSDQKSNINGHIIACIGEDETSSLLPENTSNQDSSRKFLPSLNDSNWSLALPQTNEIIEPEAEERAAGAVSWNVYIEKTEDIIRRGRLLAKKRMWAMKIVRLNKSTSFDTKHHQMYNVLKQEKDEPKAKEEVLRVPEKHRVNVATMGIFVCRKCRKYVVSPSALPLDQEADVVTSVGLCDTCKTLDMLNKIK